jgi:hypothetical protein
MSEVDDIPSLKALLAKQLGTERRQQSGTVAGRKKSERAAMRPKDDLRFSHRGETVQLNVNVEEHWKVWLKKAKSDYRLDIFEIVERGLELVKAELEGKGSRHA